MFRDGKYLYYSAQDGPLSTYPYFIVTNTTETVAGLFGAGGNLAVVRGNAGVSLGDAYTGGNELRWFGHYFGSPADTHVIFGGDEIGVLLPIHEVNQYTNVVYGYTAGVATNYARLTIAYPSSTNGPIAFDSQSAGIAGTSREVVFQSNGVLVANMQGVGDSPFSTLAQLTKQNSYLTNVYSHNLASGTNDIFTVPSGYRADILSFNVGTTNTAGGNGNLYVKTNGNYYILNVTAAAYTTNATAGINTSAGGFIFNEGETVAINNTTTGLNAVTTLLLSPNSYPIRVIKNYSLSAGDNTVYTVPAGRKAITLAWSGWLLAGGSINGLYINNSGSTRSITFHVVPSGGSADDGNIFGSTTVLNGAQKTVSLASILQPGDSVVLNTDVATATQTFWMSFLEYPF
jgi:hypothetical protein